MRILREIVNCLLPEVLNGAAERYVSFALAHLQAVSGKNNNTSRIFQFSHLHIPFHLFPFLVSKNHRTWPNRTANSILGNLAPAVPLLHRESLV